MMPLHVNIDEWLRDPTVMTHNAQCTSCWVSFKQADLLASLCAIQERGKGVRPAKDLPCPAGTTLAGLRVSQSSIPGPSKAKHHPMAYMSYVFCPVRKFFNFAGKGDRASAFEIRFTCWACFWRGQLWLEGGQICCRCKAIR